MANKAQKRQAQKHKAEVKAQTEHMANLSEVEIVQLENYATFQILYINDVAYNLCKFLGDELKTIPYRTKSVQKVYGALMKRWAAYQSFINATEMNMESVAALFCEMDEYIDDRVSKFRNAVEHTLTEAGVENAHWVASVETALTVCDYAEQVSKDIIERLVKVSKRISLLIPLVVAEPARVMGNLADMVQQIHVRVELDLNTVPEVQTAFRQLNKAFLDPNNFKKAQTTADEENIAEGRMTIM